MEIAIGIFTLLATIVTIKLQFFAKPKQELENLQIQFKATQKLSLQVQKELEEFICKYDAAEREIFSGVKYKDYLMEMKTTFNENLSDELYNQISTRKLSKSIIESMTKSLETQFTALSQIHTNLKLLLHNSNNQ